MGLVNLSNHSFAGYFYPHCLLSWKNGNINLSKMCLNRLIQRGKVSRSLTLLRRQKSEVKNWRNWSNQSTLWFLIIHRLTIRFSMRTICTRSLGHFRPRPDERGVAQNWRDVGHNPTLSSPHSSPIPEPSWLLPIFSLRSTIHFIFLSYIGIYMMNKWKDSDVFTTLYMGEGDPKSFAQ
jgi:hypothetical protein